MGRRREGRVHPAGGAAPRGREGPRAADPGAAVRGGRCLALGHDGAQAGADAALLRAQRTGRLRRRAPAVGAGPASGALAVLPLRRLAGPAGRVLLGGATAPHEPDPGPRRAGGRPRVGLDRAVVPLRARGLLRPGPAALGPPGPPGAGGQHGCVGPRRAAADRRLEQGVGGLPLHLLRRRCPGPRPGTPLGRPGLAGPAAPGAGLPGAGRRPAAARGAAHQRDAGCQRGRRAARHRAVRAAGRGTRGPGAGLARSAHAPDLRPARPAARARAAPAQPDRDGLARCRGGDGVPRAAERGGRPRRPRGPRVPAARADGSAAQATVAASS